MCLLCLYNEIPKVIRDDVYSLIFFKSFSVISAAHPTISAHGRLE